MRLGCPGTELAPSTLPDNDIANAGTLCGPPMDGQLTVLAIVSPAHGPPVTHSVSGAKALPAPLRLFSLPVMAAWSPTASNVPAPIPGQLNGPLNGAGHAAGRIKRVCESSAVAP